jgi:hypothetical protein
VGEGRRRVRLSERPAYRGGGVPRLQCEGLTPGSCQEYRVAAAINAGRFLGVAPYGYVIADAGLRPQSAKAAPRVRAEEVDCRTVIRLEAVPERAYWQARWTATGWLLCPPRRSPGLDVGLDRRSRPAPMVELGCTNDLGQ